MNAPVAPVRLQPEFVQRPIPEAFLQALVQRFGAQCSTALAVREQHGRDEGAIQAPPPAAVVFAESTQDVQDALKLADQHAVPVIPYGAAPRSKAICWPSRAASAWT
jgi:D-lactate dehydrogenase (cytochrome)